MSSTARENCVKAATVNFNLPNQKIDIYLYTHKDGPYYPVMEAWYDQIRSPALAKDYKIDVGEFKGLWPYSKQEEDSLVKSNLVCWTFIYDLAPRSFSLKQLANLKPDLETIK